jgi:hypothetical protein
MNRFPALPPYKRVSPFLSQKKSFFLSLILGFLIVGCVVESASVATAYGAVGLGLCFAAIYGVHTVDSRGQC